MRIRFACDTCKAVFVVGQELAGKRSSCSHCKTKLVIPECSQISDKEFHQLKTTVAFNRARGGAKPNQSPKPSKVNKDSLPASGSSPRQRFNDGLEKSNVNVGRGIAGNPNDGKRTSRENAFLTTTNHLVPIASSDVQSELPFEFVGVVHDDDDQPYSVRPSDLPNDFASQPVMVEPFRSELADCEIEFVADCLADETKTPEASDYPAGRASQTILVHSTPPALDVAGVRDPSSSDPNHLRNGGSGGIAPEARVNPSTDLKLGEMYWYVCPPSGGQFGPATTQLLRRWVREKRVGPKAYVWHEGWSEWKLAGDVLPEYTKPINGTTSTVSHDDEIRNSPSVVQATISRVEDAATVQQRNKQLKRRRSMVWVTGMSIGMLVFIGLIILLLVLIGR